MTYAKIVRWTVAPLLAIGLSVAAVDKAAAEPPFFIVVETAPPEIEEYPSMVYEGHPVYYVDGRYYYRDSGRWGYYREPPRAVRDHRWERRAAVRAHERREAVRDHERREAARDHERREAVRAHERRDAVRDHERRDAVREHERREPARDNRDHERRERRGEVHVAPRAR